MPERSKKILIVGCGYRGKRIAVRLIEQGYAVRGLTRLSDHAAELQKIGIEPFIGDVTRLGSLSGIGEGVCAVYHLMGSMSGNDAQLQQLHVDGTRNILNELKTADLKRYIYESSTAVYGQIDGEWIDETAPRKPASTIGKMRVQAEDILLDAFRNQKLPLIILRPSSIYRPEGVINKKIKDGTYVLTSDPEKLMNHIYVEDFLEIMVQALTKGTPGEAYNVCDDEPKRWIDYANTIADLMNAPRPKVEWKDVDGCAEVVRLSNKRCSNKKLKRDFGMALKFPTYREGLSESARLGWREESL